MPYATQNGGSARSRRPSADYLTLRRSPSTGSRLRCPAGRSRGQPSTHVTRTALLDRCSEQEYEAVGTDGCPAAEVRDHCGPGDGPGGGVRESDVADLPVSHEVVQCGDGFFDRCVCAGRSCAAGTGRWIPCRDARRLPPSCRAGDLPAPGPSPTSPGRRPAPPPDTSRLAIHLNQSPPRLAGQQRCHGNQADGWSVFRAASVEWTSPS